MSKLNVLFIAINQPHNPGLRVRPCARLAVPSLRLFHFTPFCYGNLLITQTRNIKLLSPAHFITIVFHEIELNSSTQT